MIYNNIITLIINRVGSEYISTHTDRAKDLFNASIRQLLTEKQYEIRDLRSNVLKDYLMTINDSGVINLNSSNTDIDGYIVDVLDIVSDPDRTTTDYLFVKKTESSIKAIAYNSYLAPFSNTIYWYKNENAIRFYPKDSVAGEQVIVRYIGEPNLETIQFNNSSLTSYFSDNFVNRAIDLATERLYREING